MWAGRLDLICGRRSDPYADAEWWPDRWIPPDVSPEGQVLAASRWYRLAGACSVWESCGTLYDRSPRWYLEHAPEAIEVREWLVWLSHSQRGTLTAAGECVLRCAMALRDALSRAESAERQRRAKR